MTAQPHPLRVPVRPHTPAQHGNRGRAGTAGSTGQKAGTTHTKEQHMAQQDHTTDIAAVLGEAITRAGQDRSDIRARDALERARSRRLSEDDEDAN